jgi:hypothetical protein
MRLVGSWQTSEDIAVGLHLLVAIHSCHTAAPGTFFRILIPVYFKLDRLVARHNFNVETGAIAAEFHAVSIYLVH